MKDGFMILVIIAVMLTPMFPILLKSKCPCCGKRKLEHLETSNEEVNGKKRYITFYRCHNCENKFERNKSGPLKQVPKPVEAVELPLEEQPAESAKSDLISV